MNPIDNSVGLPGVLHLQSDFPELPSIICGRCPIGKLLENITQKLNMKKK